MDSHLRVDPALPEAGLVLLEHRGDHRHLVSSELRLPHGRYKGTTSSGKKGFLVKNTPDLNNCALCNKHELKEGISYQEYT